MSGVLDIALVFPPLWYYPLPPGELFGTARHLESLGFATMAIDYNAESADRLLSNDVVGEVMQAQGRSSGARPLLDVARAKAALRAPSTFYDLAEHRRAASTLDAAWQAISRAHAPTSIDFLKLNLACDDQSLDTCLAVSNDPARNPYLALINRDLVPRIAAHDPRCIGLLYVHPDQIVPLLTLAQALRKQGYPGHIVVFGSLEDQVTFWRFLRARTHVDYAALFRWLDSVVVYEPEPALSELLRRLRQRQSLEGVANLAWWDGEVLHHPASIEVMNLGQLPARHLGAPASGHYLFPEPVLTYVASRGCYWARCAFCAIAQNQTSYRARGVAAVLDDLEHLVTSRGPCWVHFRDMLMSPSQLRHLSRGLVERGLPVRWTCRCRVEPGIDERLLSSMVKAGCAQLWLGMESAADRVLQDMDKGTSARDSERVLSACARTGMGVHMLAMFGFPGERESEAEATVAFLEDHAAQIDSVSYSNFVLFDTAPMFAQARERGLTLRPQRSLLQYKFEHYEHDERVAVEARYHALRQRLDRTFAMPFFHSICVPMQRAFHGEGWRSAAARSASA